MKLRVPYIDWREPWIIQEIAEITVSKLLLLKVNFFSTKGNSNLDDSVGALFDEH